MARSKRTSAAKEPSRSRSYRAVRTPKHLGTLGTAKRLIERKLKEHVRLRHKHGARLYRKHINAEIRNLIGVAISHSHAVDGATHAESAPPGEPVLLVLLEKPRQHSQVRRLLRRLIGAKAASAKCLPFEILVTGTVHAHAQTLKLRPAAPGTSVSNCAAPSGTFGFLARGRSGPRQNQLLIVSNTHVLVSDPGAPNVTGVAQPGRTDGGSCPSEQIAQLEKFVPILFGGGANHVDGATAVAPAGLVRRELMILQGSNPVFVPIGGSPAATVVGMIVGKSGRQTSLTMGRVVSTSSTVIATYGIRTALFQDQILVMGLNGLFSDAGDSGSLVWTWDQQRNPVGLLFGGANGVSFVCHIGDVLDALDIDFA